MTQLVLGAPNPRDEQASLHAANNGRSGHPWFDLWSGKVLLLRIVTGCNLQAVMSSPKAAKIGEEDTASAEESPMFSEVCGLPCIASGWSASGPMRGNIAILTGCPCTLLQIRLPVPEQKLHNGVTVPLVLHCQRPDCTVEDTVAWVSSSLPFLEDKLRRHGAILFRGFPLPTANEFDTFVRAFTNYENLP